MKLHPLTQAGWEDAANSLRERDKKYGISKLMVPAVAQPQTEDGVTAPALTTFGERLECLDIVPGISQMPHWTSRPSSSLIRCGSGKLRLNTSIPVLAPAAKPDSALIQNVKPVQLISFYTCRQPPNLTTIWK